MKEATPSSASRSARKWLYQRGDRFTDWACDLPETRWLWVNDLPFTANEQAQHLFCALFGHYVIGDQCGKPEHDYCYLCGTRKPGQATRSSDEVSP